MKLVVLVALLGASAPLVEAAQARRAAPPVATQPPDRTAEAYEQFLRAHLLEDEDADAAIAAYKRAIELDPASSAIPADLAELYLRESRLPEAVAAAEQSLKVSSTNRDAHRVLGNAYASMAGGSPGQRTNRAAQQENLIKAVQHLELAFEPPIASADANLRALLARLYLAIDSYDKAIPILSDLVKEEPGWPDGPNLLMEAYSAAGRSADAQKWLEENAPDNPTLYQTLGEFYARARRYGDAATAFENALRASPASRSFDLRIGLASALLGSAGHDDYVRAREVLNEALQIRTGNETALYLLSQAEMGAGDSVAAEATARKLIAQNAKEPNGYVALALALEEQRRFQPLVDVIAPALATFRGANNGAVAVGMLLPHLGIAYQELGDFDKSIAAFEEAQKNAPNNSFLTRALIQVKIAAKKYSTAADLARAARLRRPTDLQFARLESIALRKDGKIDQGIAVLEAFAKANPDDVEVPGALAQAYVDAERGAEAVKVLRDAQAKFPGETGLVFELGAVLDKLKRYGESETIFRDLIAKEPQNAVALNYLGYMLAERGERLNESVDFLKRALAIDPNNGSYLDSIGWAYFKDGKLDLAHENLKRAADQLTTNSVVQDHYGDVLFKLGRYDDAIGAWSRALSGDGDSIDRTGIDKKIKSARQKLPKR